MRLAWLTDVHLECVERPDRDELWSGVRSRSPDAVLLGGDISQANEIDDHLDEIESALACPVYFVLGNHDYMAGGVENLRLRMRARTERSNVLRWLPAIGLVSLTERTGLIGHGCWGDGRYGDIGSSTVYFNEFFSVREFLDLFGGRISEGDPFAPEVCEARRRLLNRLGDEAAVFVRDHLPRAFDRHEEMLLLTHVPPFLECAARDSSPGVFYGSEPHMGCKAVGDALIEIMADHPDRSLRVLSGHTHRPLDVRIRSNLRLTIGGARLGRPAPCGELDLA